jgi:hypothetical protein
MKLLESASIAVGLAFVISPWFGTAPAYGRSTLDDNRNSLVALLNEEKFLAPVLDDGNLAQGAFGDSLLPPDERGRGWRAAKKGLAVGLGTLGGGLLGFAIGGPVGAGIGAGAGAAGYATAAADLNAAQLNRGSSFVVDMPFYDELVVDDVNVTSMILSSAVSNVVRTDSLGWSTNNSISFVDPALLSAFVIDGNGDALPSSQYLGIDLILLKRTDERGTTESAIGFAVYNDPNQTGRALQMTDRIFVNLSAFGIHFGDAISFNGTLLIASPRVPAPSGALALLLAIPLASRRRR